MISENKMKHSIEVARECREIARQLKKSEYVQDACFIMGFLHDVGYEKVDENNITEHPEKGYEMLLSFNASSLLYIDVIKNHGTKYTGLNVFDYVLNKADLTINYLGDKVSEEERLEGIKQRYGEDSSHYNNALKMYQAVKDYEATL